jgi:thiol-disulfide isomerase/thioredoxin
MSSSAASPTTVAAPTPELWQAVFEQALPYDAFLKEHATPDQRERWNAFRGKVVLTQTQKTLLGSFTRRMPVVVLAGAWCGDCVNQCPIFEHFAAACPNIDVRYLDRDARQDVATLLKVCGGSRVPVVQFLSEDFHPVVFYGDKTLAAYRAVAAAQLGPSCPTGLVHADDSIAAVVSDWLEEFERVQLILRLSGRLRQLHGD